ncbi:MAG: serine protease, partial [Phenylobacterium sp.]
RVCNNNHMFTNNHCLDNESRLQNTEIWFNYQRTTCGGSTDSGTIKVTGKDLLKTDANLDYSLFTVNDFSNIASFGNFGLDPRAPELNEIIYIAQHGAGNRKELSIESDQNEGNLCRIDSPSIGGRDAGYLCDTTGGSSGSPVLAGSTNQVIALHHFGGCENAGVRIDKIWPQVSDFFGGVVPQGDGGTTLPNQAPVAEMSFSCTELSCTFDGSGSSDVDGTIGGYSWNINGTAASGQTANHTFASAGSYSVSLTVTDNDNATNTQTQTVAVSDSHSTNELQSGVPINNQAGAKDAEADYFINTTANDSEVVISMSGGTGDADLYVKKGGIPTKTSYDCRPYETGNNETCTVTVGTPGTVNVKLIGYSAYSGVSLVATATSDGGPTNDFPQTGISGTSGDWARYIYTVPAGVSTINVSTTGGSGDSDLYVKNGAEPTTSAYDCRPYASGNEESCSVAVSAGEVVHIGLRAYYTYSGVTLDVK